MPIRCPLMTALAAECQRHSRIITSGAKAPSNFRFFGTAESRALPRGCRWTDLVAHSSLLSARVAIAYRGNSVPERQLLIARRFSAGWLC